MNAIVLGNSGVSKHKLRMVKTAMIAAAAVPLAVLSLNTIEYVTGKADSFNFPYGVFLLFGCMLSMLLIPYTMVRYQQHQNNRSSDV